ncbi:HRP1 [Symbiodinium pilosum]|uniref:HRP1 protein n=1 Tax=Symbiodinium pilosum TaxID=2952 RepID=A0A812W0A6_SYMPI|nr:HRP1 [Symbiodinium pilosum]
MERGGPFKVFVGGLPQDCTNDILVDYFGKYGNITDVVVMTDRATGRSRGFGFVSFDTLEAVDAIMSMHTEHKIQDKWVDCKRATAEGTKGVPQKGGGKGSGPPAPANSRPGDWICQECGASVFGSKDSCFKCGAPRPSQSGGGGGGGGGYRGPSYNAAPPPAYNAAPPPDYGACSGSCGADALLGGFGMTAYGAYGGGACGGVPGVSAYGCGAGGASTGGAYGACAGGACGYGACGCGACGCSGGACGGCDGCNGYLGCPASYAPTRGQPDGRGGGDQGYAPY